MPCRRAATLRHFPTLPGGRFTNVDLIGGTLLVSLPGSERPATNVKYVAATFLKRHR